MAYFVTGATGFIGRRLVKKLLQREGEIYFLILEREMPKLEELRVFWGANEQRIIPVVGDLTRPNLGVSEADLAKLKGQLKHMFHLAAIYDLKASLESQHWVNIEGTRNAVAFAEAANTGCFHLTSSIAAAGLYEGVFREDMFEEAEGLDHPYFRTKHDSEGIVRQECKVPWRVYRPGIVVGSSETGEMDKIDGPYYFFKLIQKLRRILPSWLPTIGLEGGRLNLVPVNFVVNAMDHIAHLEGQDGRCFHLVDPDPKRIGDALNIFAQAAHAPAMAMRVNARLFDFIPSAIRTGLSLLPPVRRIVQQVLTDVGIPEDMLSFISWPTRYDCRETTKLLKGTGIRVPPLEEYAWKLWDYWERHLDPELFVDHSLSGQIKGKVILLTGASSGIGKATALKLGEAGAKIILVARGEEKLLETKQEVEALGGESYIYTADLADLDSCDKLVEQVEAEHGGVDILINNAGRSIRRSIINSFDRFHDFQRTMQLNYFGCLRITLGFLPTMLKKQAGQVINVSSIGVLASSPRFSAYVASKAALEAFTRCASAELADAGIKFTNINMPLVYTPMTAPTKIYQHLPLIYPEEAADLVVEAIINKPLRVATRLGIFAQIFSTLAPKVYQTVMNTSYHLFPESAAAKGIKEEKAEKPSPEQIAFAQLTSGIYW